MRPAFCASPINFTFVISKKEQIFLAARKLFRHKGYVSSSMQDIANELNIKAASLYNHIQSKHEILQELLVEGGELFARGMFEIKGSSLPAMEKLERLIALHVRLSIDHTDLMALMMVEWRHLEEPALSQYRTLRDDYENDFREILQQAIEEEKLEGVHQEIALFSMLTTLQRFYAWYDKRSNMNALDLEKHTIKCLLDGIRMG